MTPGQELAIEQLSAIQEADGDAFEIVRTQLPSEGDPFLSVTVRLSCRGIDRVPGGLPLRERERFVIWVAPSFPFSVPLVWTPHDRFAGRPHVQWKRHLCIYQAPQTEWDASDGMFGFIDRLWVWLEHGAKDLADPVGLPIHPPIAYTGESKHILVPRVNAPGVTEGPWYGFAGLRAVNERALSIVNWQPATNPGDPSGPVAAVILLPRDLPWEMPKSLDGLCKELEGSGATRQLLLCLLRWTMLVNPKEHPLFVIVGSPQRGVQSAGQLKHHLMAWQVSGLMLDALNVSADSIRLLFDLGGLTTPESEDLRRRIKATQEAADRIAMESVGLVDVNWCQVLEDRPEVITRRDERSALGVFRGRTVCLWGCGALGSHVAYYLVKAGVKKLTMLDSGIVKPGLLVRQMFGDAEIGEAKATALKRRLERMHPGVEIEALQRTVLEDANDWATGADFVIDCTASDTVHARSELAWALERRNGAPAISMVVGPAAQRGIAVLIRPESTGALKDAFRKAKLLAVQRPELAAFVEDFYPRGNAIKLFQPEPGCSEPTFEGSSADIASLSALLLNSAAGLLRSTPSPAAACLVCQPQAIEPKSGQAAYAQLSFEADILCQGDYLVRLAPKAWKEMVATIRQCRRMRGARCETGGLLFGKRDDALRVFWVDDAIGPPPDSLCAPDKFICGTKGTQEANKRRREQSRGSVEFIGMWHTHPENLALPSETDLAGMAQMLTTGEAPPLKSLLLIVGWERRGIVLGTSVFSRRMFREGGGVVAVAAHHFPELKA